MTYKFKKDSVLIFRKDEIYTYHLWNGIWYPEGKNDIECTLNINNIPKSMRNYYRDCPVFKIILKELFYQDLLK